MKMRNDHRITTCVMPGMALLAICYALVVPNLSRFTNDDNHKLTGFGQRTSQAIIQVEISKTRLRSMGLDESSFQKDVDLKQALATLFESQDEQALNFLQSELAGNTFLKDTNGKRKIFGYGSDYGCVVFFNEYGVYLIQQFEEYQNSNAIPVLREAFWEGDGKNSVAAYSALNRFQNVHTQELFGITLMGERSVLVFVDKILHLNFMMIYPYQLAVLKRENAVKRIRKDYQGVYYYQEAIHSREKDNFRDYLERHEQQKANNIK